ncbi:hypothetical protein P8452_08083 [Trifolium repens]|nr:hypothetical protein P8452_08083 [Trifolium repens]
MSHQNKFLANLAVSGNFLQILANFANFVSGNSKFQEISYRDCGKRGIWDWEFYSNPSVALDPFAVSKYELTEAYSTVRFPEDSNRNRIWASVLALIVCRVRMNLIWPIVRKMQDHVWSQDTIAKFADFNDDEGGLLVATYRKEFTFGVLLERREGSLVRLEVEVTTTTTQHETQASPPPQLPPSSSSSTTPSITTTTTHQETQDLPPPPLPPTSSTTPSTTPSITTTTTQQEIQPFTPPQLPPSSSSTAETEIVPYSSPAQEAPIQQHPSTIQQEQHALEVQNGMKEAPHKPHTIRSAVSLEDSILGRSYRMALTGGVPGKALKVLKVSVNEELCRELQGSVVGTFAHDRDVRRIQTTLSMEGYRSISVTHMGGNMAILRSSMEGDVARLLRSKNECLQYYFSELKPWNPGLLAVKREVWVQIHGIPLHIWGETLFKQVGNNLGEFLDFDDETARMARFDVARVKILSQTWGCIDVVQKVEVEGVCFDIWVVEERGRQQSMMALNEDREDEGSRVAPVAASDKVDEVSGEGAEGSGSDDMSGDELEVDGRGNMLLVEEHEVGCNSVQCNQVTKERNETLTSEKSTNFCNSQMEILSAPVEKGNSEEVVIGHNTQEVLLVENTACGDNSCQEVGGAKQKGGTEVLNLSVEVGGPLSEGGPLSVGAGLSRPMCDPFPLVFGNPAQVYSDPPFLGRLVEDDVYRCSYFSEPEEVLSPHRSKATKPKPNSRMKRNKSCSKFNQLGVPMCIKLAEAMKEASGRAKKLRKKGSGVGRNGGGNESEAGGVGGMTNGESVVVGGNNRGGPSRQGKRQKGPVAVQTPNSGLGLLSGSESSFVPESRPPGNDGDKTKLIEAAKLLDIQNQVGFTFEEAKEDTIKHLVEQETCDRAKKKDWEDKIGDQ